MVRPLMGVAAALIGTGTMRVLAQGSTSVDPGITSIVGNVGIMGVLVWYLWYHTTHSYPALLDKFAVETKQLRDSFAAETKELRDAFTREQEKLRADHARDVTELRNMLIRSAQAMRVAVHDVKDAANAAILGVRAESTTKPDSAIMKVGRLS